jgi:hypothetical protein
MATLINFEASILFILSFFPYRCSAFEKAEEELNLKVIVIRRNKGYFITALYSPVFYISRLHFELISNLEIASPT